MGLLWKGSVVGLVALIVLYLFRDKEEEFTSDIVRGKNVLVTGASSGIGEEMAYLYAQMGANVFITARRQNLLKKVCDKCQTLGIPGAKFGYIEADMGFMPDTERVIKSAVETLGTIDYLILNHARVNELTMSFWEGHKEDLVNLQAMLDINFRSFVHLTANAMPHMNKESGTICAVSSVAGKLPYPFMLGYSASKFAIDGFFNGLRQELNMKNDNNITVTLAILGNIDTESGRSVLQRFIQTYNLSHEKFQSAMTPVSAKDTAFAIIKSTIQGDQELYYPPSQWIQSACIVRAIKQSVTDWIIYSFAA